MRSYSLTEAAEEDLKGIWNYLSAKSQAAANKFIHEIHARFDMIVDNPDIGRERDAFSEGLRSLVSGTHLIFYRVIYDEIRITRVVHGAMDLTKISFD